jgi:hypothetical protein
MRVMIFLRPAQTTCDADPSHGVGLTTCCRRSRCSHSLPQGRRPSRRRSRACGRYAVNRSPTVARLLQDIEASDSIVYIDLQFDTRADGLTTLFASNDQCRFIRVVISRMAPYPRRIEMLGHELHHALEIIRAPDVRVAADLRRLYAQIGWVVSDANFESNGAIDTERQVRREMMVPALRR